MSGLELNVENYTLDELLKILKVNSDDPTLDEINNQVVNLKNKVKNEPEMEYFLDQVHGKILKNLNGDNISNVEKYNNEYDNEDKQYSKWISEQYLDNNADTDPLRRQKMELFDHEHNTMKRERLDIKQEFNVSVAQGEINPRLTNTITRVTSLDSKFRKNGVTNIAFSSISNHYLSSFSSTDFLIELTEPLRNVLSIQLYSLNVPYSWYNIDVANNTNSFTFTPTGSATSQTITLPSGNYTSSDLVLDLSSNNAAVSTATYNEKTGKITINFTSSGEVVFFSEANDICSKNHFVNNNFGWTMGFRDATYTTNPDGSLTSDSPYIRHNTKSLLLAIEDFNVNHASNGLVGIKNIEKPLDIPRYRISDVSGTSLVSSNNCNIDVSNNIYNNYPVFTQGFPRQITQAQQYTLNEIIKSRTQLTTTKAQGPNIPNLFAVVPIKTNGLTLGDPIVEFSGGIQSNIRNYFGPVDIEKLHVRLLDDMGNVLNLNGNDWSFVIKSEHLYQY